MPLNECARLDSIDLSLLIDELSNTLRKHDSAVPDSLGDRLFRMVLKLKWERRCGKVSSELVRNAVELLIEAAPKYSAFYAARWVGEFSAEAA